MPPLTEKTRIKVTIAGAIVFLASAAGAVWKVQSILTQIRDSVREVSTAVASLQRDTDTKMAAVNAALQDRFTLAASAEWALRMKVSNPTMRIPDPRNPSTMLGEP